MLAPCPLTCSCDDQNLVDVYNNSMYSESDSVLVSLHIFQNKNFRKLRCAIYVCVYTSVRFSNYICGEIS